MAGWIRSFIALAIVYFLMSSGESIDNDADNNKCGEHSSLFERQFLLPVRDVRSKLQVGVTFVPIIGKSSNFTAVRAAMFARGIYPGVDYTLEGIQLAKACYGDSSATYDAADQGEHIAVNSMRELSEQVSRYNDSASRFEDVQMIVRPSYPLIPMLEREWPVVVPLRSIPYVLTKGMYNALTAVVAVAVAIALYSSASLISQLFTLSVINTRSMQPAIMPKDVILVQKVVPFGLVPPGVGHATSLPSSGEVIFFKEPASMRSYIEAKGLRPVKPGELLVKRVFRLRYGREESTDSAASGACIEVHGDNAAVSIDSRQFGCVLPKDVIGRPVLRVWPPARIGVLK